MPDPLDPRALVSGRPSTVSPTLAHPYYDQPDFEPDFRTTSEPPLVASHRKPRVAPPRHVAWSPTPRSRSRGRPRVASSRPTCARRKPLRATARSCAASGATSSVVKSRSMKPKPASTTSPAAPGRPSGRATPASPRRTSKAERLLDLTLPAGPEFPLDDDIVADLADYPGELPTSADHFVSLLDPRESEST